MATFSYNPNYAQKSYQEQYLEYLQREHKISARNTDVNAPNFAQTLATYRANELNETIRNAADGIGIEIAALGGTITSSLSQGFEGLNQNLMGIQSGLDGINDGIYSANRKLNAVNDNLTAIGNLMGHGFSMLRADLNIANQQLDNIMRLLRIPDSQKQRAYHIHEGIKYLRNAIHEGIDSEFYTDALEELDKAVAIEKRDFFSLYHIGLIRLSSKQHFDAEKAETALKDAARYYGAEANIGGTEVTKNLLPETRGLIRETAEAYLLQAQACYLQQKYTDAASLAEKAYTLLPELQKAAFMQAKYLACGGRGDAAAQILNELIAENRFVSLQVLEDYDLVTAKPVVNLLNTLQNNAVDKAKNALEKSRSLLVQGSQAAPLFKDLEALINKATFLEAHEALDKMQVKGSWQTLLGGETDKRGNPIAQTARKPFSGNLLDFLAFEKPLVDILPKSLELIAEEKQAYEYALTSAKMSNNTLEQWLKLSDSNLHDVLLALAQNPNAAPEALAKVAKNSAATNVVYKALVQNPNNTGNNLIELSKRLKEDNVFTFTALFVHKNVTEEIALLLLKQPFANENFQQYLAKSTKNINTQKALAKGNVTIKELLLKSENVSDDLRIDIVKAIMATPTRLSYNKEEIEDCNSTLKEIAQTTKNQTLISILAEFPNNWVRNSVVKNAHVSDDTIIQIGKDKKFWNAYLEAKEKAKERGTDLILKINQDTENNCVQAVDVQTLKGFLGITWNEWLSGNLVPQCAQKIRNPEILKLLSTHHEHLIHTLHLSKNPVYNQYKNNGFKDNRNNPTPTQTNNVSNSTQAPKNPSPCYIATAAYGSPYAIEVDTFRYFRDTVLVKSCFGRAFIAFYYKTSPPLADFIADREYLKAATRKWLLAPLLHFLHKK